jgi:peptidyl-prolyl cis-trans isomerase C
VLESLKGELSAASNPDVLEGAFAEKAQLLSECPSAASGGSLGSFGPGQMVPEFDKVVFGDAVGVVHGPVKTQFGHHLILITERSD